MHETWYLKVFLIRDQNVIHEVSTSKLKQAAYDSIHEFFSINLKIRMSSYDITVLFSCCADVSHGNLMLVAWGYGIWRQGLRQIFAAKGGENREWKTS